MSKILLYISVLLCFLLACQKEETDNVKPTVNILQPVAGDTLHLATTYMFKAVFWDDKGLSSYKIQVLNPNTNVKNRLIPSPNTLDSTKIDSLLYLDQTIQRINIFDIKDTAVTVQHTFVLDSLGYFEGRGPFDIVRGVYQFKVVVMDKAGNRDSSFFNVNIASPIVD